MNFDLSEEQTMIRDSLMRFVMEHYDLDGRNASVAMRHGFSPAHWQRFAELGWLSIPFSEDVGGFGGDAVDTMVIMQELGRGLVAEPFLPTVILFGGLLETAADDDLKQRYLPAVIAGELQGAFAYLEKQSRYELTDVVTRAQKTAAGWSLHGEKVVVLNGGVADKLVVLARTSGGQSDDHGLSLFLVDGSVTGLERTSFRMTDGREAANIKLNNVVAEAVIGDIDQGMQAVNTVLDHARLAVSAEALGVMESLNAQTLEHLKTRKQFDVTIGSFQALQHRAVDMMGAAENVRSLLYRAVCRINADDDDAALSLLALKVMVGRAGRLIGGEAIQMHGGMGMTDELAVGFYAKRLMIINTLFGDADTHQQQFIELANALEGEPVLTDTQAA